MSAADLYKQYATDTREHGRASGVEHEDDNDAENDQPAAEEQPRPRATSKWANVDIAAVAASMGSVKGTSDDNHAYLPQPKKAARKEEDDADHGGDPHKARH